MSVSRLPSGRYRAQVYVDGKVISAAKILGLDDPTFPSKRKAQDAVADARRLLKGRKRSKITVAQFAERWTTDELFLAQRPKDSTRMHNEERIRRFVERYGSLPLDAIGDDVVGDWLAGNKNISTVPVLKAMFNDAKARKAGRLIDANPWEGLGIKKGKGRGDEEIPSEELVRKVIAAAREHTNPSFAAWLQVGAYTGMRPGELDGLRWDRILWDEDRIRVWEQWNNKARKVTSTKTDERRLAILTPPAREALLSLTQTGPYCFTNLHGNHWTVSARAYHWKAVRAASGYQGDFYEAGRHFAGWYMTNVLGLPPELVAIALGHKDGGKLVISTYGHRDKDAALGQVLDAYKQQSNVVQLKMIKGDGA